MKIRRGEINLYVRDLDRAAVAALGPLRVALAGVDRGPRDLQALADYFGQANDREGYGEYDIEVIAEINHAPQLTLDEILIQARDLARDGADMIWRWGPWKNRLRRLDTPDV